MEALRRAGDDGVALGRRVLSKRRPAVSPGLPSLSRANAAARKEDLKPQETSSAFLDQCGACVGAHQVREKDVGGKDDVEEGGSSCRRTGGRARKKSTHPLAFANLDSTRDFPIHCCILAFPTAPALAAYTQHAAASILSLQALATPS